MYSSGILTAKGDLARVQEEGGTRQAYLKNFLESFLSFFSLLPFALWWWWWWCGGVVVLLLTSCRKKGSTKTKIRHSTGTIILLS